MREPGVDSACPLVQIELWKEWLEHHFQSSQDLANFFTGMARDPTEGVQFV